MDAISNTSNSTAVTSTQTLLNSSSSPDSTAQKENTNAPVTSGSTTSAADDFSAFLTKALGGSGQNQVSEEELFSSIIDEQLNQKDPAASTFYEDQVKQLSVSMARPSDGYVPVEDVAKAALKATVAAGKVTEQDAELINGTAFASAQLDANTQCLYDNRGSTSATDIASSATSKAKAVMDQIKAGSGHASE